jgi:large subunit ribosomal protein L9
LVFLFSFTWFTLLHRGVTFIELGGSDDNFRARLIYPVRRNHGVCLRSTDMTALGGLARNTGEFVMEVILKEDVANLGHRGDVVKVAEGYGRNFLLPRKLALQATLANKAVVEQMKSAAARRSASEKAVAEALVAKLEPVVLSFTRKTGEAGQLFGSVTSADIAAGLESKGFEVDRRKIQVAEPIKSLGDFTVAIKLHREVTAHVKVKVVAEATAEAPAEPVAEAAAE